MYNKEQLNDLYERIVSEIDISDTLFESAVQEYIDMGNWIDKKTPEYKVTVYAQGSFALGTVIKPLTDTDDYDLDLVCEFDTVYGVSAEKLKCDIVKPLLESYKKINGEIEEKRRCWHVEYESLPNFHMDIIPAVNHSNFINITDRQDDNTYEYIGSNPKGYIDWFDRKKAERRNILLERFKNERIKTILCSADIEEIKEYQLKTPLQKAIQILKRHRDIMFENDENNNQPISIIITTIAADLYKNEDNIVDTLNNFFENAETYIKQRMIGMEYHIDNPSYTGPDVENFADKWNSHPERASAFFSWLKKAKADLVDPRLYNLVRTEMAENLRQALGIATTERVFGKIAKEERIAIENQTKKIVTSTGAISESGSISIPRSHHYGK